MVGQSPARTEEVDDKAATNAWLAKQDGLQGTFPKARLVHDGEGSDQLEAKWKELKEGGGSVVCKPIRGRGSHGVSVVRSVEELDRAVKGLLKESNAVLLEVSLHWVFCRLYANEVGVLQWRGDHSNCPPTRRVLRSRIEGDTLGITRHPPNWLQGR